MHKYNGIKWWCRMHTLVGVLRISIVRMTTILIGKRRYMSSLSNANLHNKLKFHFQEKHVCEQQSGNFQIKLFGCSKLMKFYVFCILGVCVNEMNSMTRMWNFFILCHYYSWHVVFFCVSNPSSEHTSQ